MVEFEDLSGTKVAEDNWKSSHFILTRDISFHHGSAHASHLLTFSRTGLEAFQLLKNTLYIIRRKQGWIRQYQFGLGNSWWILSNSSANFVGNLTQSITVYTIMLLTHFQATLSLELKDSCCLVDRGEVVMPFTCCHVLSLRKAGACEARLMMKGQDT